MRLLLTLSLFLTLPFISKAQNGVYDVKVYTTDFHVIKGHLKVANKEGIAIDSYDGKYYILRATEI